MCRFDSTPTAWLVREGWTKESLKVGDLVTAEGFPPLGRPYAWLGKVTKEDGRYCCPRSVVRDTTRDGARRCEVGPDAK